MNVRTTARTNHILQATFLVLIVLVAYGLRLLMLDQQSLWYDEGVTATIAQYGLAELTRWTAGDIQPPLYYYLVAGWGRMAGWSEWSLRFVSVWFGTLLVPLMAVLAIRLTRSYGAGLLAAALTMLHPLLIYYSQEARMYAQLTVLGVCAGYCVVRLSEGENRRYLWLAYIGTATAAIYTHYFAFFLLLALAIAFFTDTPASAHYRQQSTDDNQARPSTVGREYHDRNRATLPLGGSGYGFLPGFTSRLVRFVLANLVVLLLYMPWFLVLVTQLNQDASYWQGALKAGEALRAVALSFTSGETVAERAGLWLLVGYSLVTAIALVRMVRRPWLHRALRYGLLWLIIPVLGVLILAMLVPKFNARYVMLALPGLLLLWGAGLSRDRRSTTTEPRSNDIGAQLDAAALETKTDGWSGMRFGVDMTQFVILSVSVAFILIASGISLFNWFTNPAFTKDDWRGVTEFLRPRLQDHEAVALISGHTWPVWEYYASDIPVVRLPDLRILDVEAVLDFADTVEPLRGALDPLSDRPGIWLIGWQDDVIDPTGVVPAQLTIAGKEKGLDTHYWGLSLRRYSQLKTHWLPDEPPIQHATDVQFGQHLILRGYGAIDNGDLLLFWQRAPGSQIDSARFVISGESFDAAGHKIRDLPDIPPAGFDYPAHRWPADRIAMGVIPARTWLGIDPAPGRYTVTLRVYDDQDAGRALLPTHEGEQSLVLGPIEVVIE